jgi:murein DD-endopeptidase MepM/ murein hydrolase activator NlpD
MPISSNNDSTRNAARSRSVLIGAAVVLLLLSAGPSVQATSAPPGAASPTQGAAAASPAKKPPRPALAVPWQVSVLTPPTIFPSNGRRHLTYEIEIANLSSDSWTLEKIEVKGDGGVTLLTVEKQDIGGLLAHSAAQSKASQSSANSLAPGEVVLAYLWIDLDDAAKPAHLSHRLTARRQGDEKTIDLDAPSTGVSSEVREIGSPLRGSNWLAANGPSNTSHHRRATLALEGALHTSQRYAIDWVQIGPDLHTYRGDPKDNRSYICYGSDVLAVADGTVVEIKDGIVENVPNQPPAVPITLETVAGNHIDLDLGGGVYAMYAHLRPGSLKVKLGDRVKRGQVIALLGNTGNSTEPHLHFQLMDRNSPLISEGLPYKLPEYTIAKRLTGDFESTPTATDLPAPELHRQEIPLEMQLVNFK